MTLHFTSGTNTAANASAYQVTGGEWASGTIQWSNKPAADVLLQSNILDMIDHFMDGSETAYSNSVLTQKAYEHDKTQAYINQVKVRYLDQYNQFIGTTYAKMEENDLWNNLLKCP